MYSELKHGDACVRLLHAGGTAGCAAPSRDAVEGVLLRITQLQPAASYPGGGRRRWGPKEGMATEGSRSMHSMLSRSRPCERDTTQLAATCDRLCRGGRGVCGAP